MKVWVKIVFAFLLTAQSALAKDVQLSSKSQWGSLAVEGLTRTYLYYVPSFAKDLNRRLPLVIVLHGGSGKPEGMEKLTFYRFDELADRDGCIVVYPAGVEHNWNDGRTDVQSPAFKRNIDDVGFISTLIDRFINNYDADPKKVYVTGISNGAMMSTKLACELADKIAAAAPVAGSMPKNLCYSCRPQFPVSMLFINGDADPLVPFNGGYVHVLFRNRGEVVSVNESVQRWADLDGCQGKPETVRLPMINREDTTWVEKTTYPSSSNGSEVLQYVIHGGGHTWPNGMKYAGEWLIGKVSRQIDATDVIWDFFMRHSR